MEKITVNISEAVLKGEKGDKGDTGSFNYSTMYEVLEAEIKPSLDKKVDKEEGMHLLEDDIREKLEGLDVLDDTVYEELMSKISQDEVTEKVDNSITGATESLTNYIEERMAEVNAGDMRKSIYDKDDDGIVDESKNAETVNNFTVQSNVPEDAVFTDTKYDDVIGTLEQRLAELEKTVTEYTSKEAELERKFKVGDFYISMNDENPATLFGGTWKRIEGKFLFGSNQWYDAGDSGGATTVTLTANNLPPHEHDIYQNGNTSQLFIAGKSHEAELINGTDKNGNWAALVYQDVGGYTTLTGLNAKYQLRAIANTTEQTAVNKMPPYLVVNIWKRTA